LPSTRLTAGNLETLNLHGVLPFHDYAAAITELVEKGFLARGRNLPPQPFRLPFHWHADPLRDRNWMFQLHAWRMLDPYLSRLLAEPDHPRAFADILEVIDDWHRGNVRRRAGRFTWYDMSTGLRALKLALLGQLAAARGMALPPPFAELVDLHMSELARPAKLSPGNHGLFQMNGLRALAWQFPNHPRSEAAAAYAMSRGSALLDRQLGPVGVHTEDAPDYHFFAVRLIERILAAPWWQVPEMAAFHERLALARDAEAWLLDPAGHCLPVGDSTEKAKPLRPGGLERWPHTRSDRRVGAVLDGYGVVRTDAGVPLSCSTMLFLTASHHLEAHKHADCLSLVWQDRNETLLADSGKYGYQRDRMRRYFLSTRAHNTVEADGRDWSRAAADAYGAGMRRVEPFGAAWILEAEADHCREGLVHRRLLLFRPHRFLLVLDHLAPRPAAGWRGRLLALGPRRYAAWWHFGPHHAVEGGQSTDLINGLVTGLAGRRNLAVTHVTSGAALRILAVKGRGGRSPQGWISRSYGTFEPAPALGFQSRARGGWQGATLFELLEPDAAPVLSLRRETGRVVLGGAGDLASGPRAVKAFALDIAPGLL
jgi:hypothetical protein